MKINIKIYISFAEYSFHKNLFYLEYAFAKLFKIIYEDYRKD